MAAWDDQATRVVTAGVASSLVMAQDALVAAEQRFEQLLDSLYVKEWTRWRLAGWELHLYGVTPTPCAVDALLRVGFTAVTEHAHPETRKPCMCRAARRTR